MHTCKVIAVANQKGGVGKTTTTAALGTGLVRKGKKVLLIDLDAQSNLTLSFGYQTPDEIPITISDVLCNLIEDKPLFIDDGILTHSSGVKIIPSSIQLSGLEATLVNTMSREGILRICVNELRPKFDYILIDCTPSLGMLTINALAAADSVVIPVQAHFLSVKGFGLLLQTISKVKRQLNPGLKVEGILLTMLDLRATFTRDMAAMLRESYDGKIKVFESEIPASVRAVETSAKGVSIYDYDPTGKIAQAYQAFTKEVLGNERQSERARTEANHDR